MAMPDASSASAASAASEGEDPQHSVRSVFRKCIGCSEVFSYTEYTQQYKTCDYCMLKKNFIPRYERLADLQPEREYWPEDEERYVAPSHAAIPRTSKLEPWQRFREFTIGAGCFHTDRYLDPDLLFREHPRLIHVQCGQQFGRLLDGPDDQAGPDPRSITFHTKVILLTELYEEIRMYPADLHGKGEKQAKKQAIHGVTFVKGQQILDTGCQNRRQELALRLDSAFPFLKRVVLQQTVWRSRGTKILKKRITHLKLEPFRGKPLIYGFMQPEGKSGGEWVLPAEREEGTLVIVGVGYSHALPLSFQVVDLSGAPDPLEHLTSLFWGREVLSCVNVAEHLDLYEHCRMPALEDPEVYCLIESLHTGIENCSPSDAELLPNAIRFVDKTQGGDVASMMAIFRIDRYITHIVYKRSQVGMWDKKQNHWRKLLSLKQMMSIVSSITLFSRKLQLYKPRFNVYTFAVLTEIQWDITKAYLTFATQALLMVLCVYGMDISNFGENSIHFAIALCVTAIVLFMVYEQIANHFAISKTFVHAKGSMLMRVDSIANVLMPLLVIALNFALLACSEQHLDMVTNATAVLCILEMDSAMLAADEDQIRDRLCCFAYRFLQETIRAKDYRYWIHAGVLKDKPHISMENCALVWLPEDKPAG